MEVSRNSLVVNYQKGIGTHKDPASHAHFKNTSLQTNYQRNFYKYENIYQLNELAKNGIDFKSKGPVSKWRTWQIEDEDKKRELEKLEEKLELKEKLEEALRAMYLYGGSLIFLITDQDSLEPFNSDTKIEGLNVIPASWITFVEIDNDISSSNFSNAKYFSLINGERIHASHCMQFKMQTIRPFWQTKILSPHLYFGNSLLMPLETQLLQYELNNNTLINMSQDSQRIVVTTPNLQEIKAKSGGAEKLKEEMANLNAMSSDISITLLGNGDTIQVLEKNYQQILEAQKDVALRILGAMRVPEVIGLGKSLTGWSNDTEGMERIYHEPMIEDQNMKLSPSLNKLDEIMFKQVGLTNDCVYEWNPLSDPNQKEEAEIKLLKIDGLLKLSELGILDQDEFIGEINLLGVTQSEIKKREENIFFDEAIEDLNLSLNEKNIPKEEEQKKNLFSRLTSFFIRKEAN